jgi:ADP-heptose:LPS heptosyltransferase
MKRTLKEGIFSFFNYAIRPFKGHEGYPIKDRIKKILVIEAGGIGDLLRVFPVIDALDHNFPHASISILIAAPVRETLDLYPEKGIFSEIIELDLRRTHRGMIRKLPLIRLIRDRGYDLVYASARGEGAREISLMAFLTGAPYRIGFEQKGLKGVYTSALEFKRDIPILRQNLELLKVAGIKVMNEKINIRIPDRDQAASDRLVSQFTRPIIVVHPSTARDSMHRMWGIDRYTSLIGELICRFQAAVVLIGSAEETGIGHHISASMNNPSLINLIGRTSIPVTAGIIKRATLFIGNDSGPLHIALALNVPSVAIFGPTSPDQVLGDDYRKMCCVVSHRVDCSPCYLHMDHHTPSCKSPRCMDGVSTEEVFEAVKALLNRGKDA